MVVRRTRPQRLPDGALAALFVKVVDAAGKAALERLATTTISTSIRAAKKGRDSRFSWLDEWSVEVDPVTEKPIALKIVLSNWVYEGIINEKSVLTMHPDYFQLSGGLERALYRIARKHAGDQEEGWTCRVAVLHEKSGSDSAPKEFARMLRKVVEADDLPDHLRASLAGDDDEYDAQRPWRGDA